MRTPKQVILQALQSARGDDLERAQSAFRNCTQKEMDEQYGHSGSTRREILDGYQKHVREVEEAIAWVNKHA